MTRRILTRIAAITLLASGTVAFAATPALAAEVDLGLDVRTATDGVVTTAVVTVTNHGTTKPGGMSLTLDTSAIDKSRATVVAPQGCAASDTGFTCAYPALNVPGPGESSVQKVVFWGPTGAAPAGSADLRATVTAAADADETNNSRTVPVAMPPQRRPILQIGEIDRAEDGKFFTDKPIPPGGKSVAFIDVINRGAVSVTGVRSVAKLPEGVRFITAGLDNCELSADKRTATCVWDDNTLIPWLLDETIDGFPSSTRLRLPVEVDKDVPGPAELGGGEWTVSSVATADPELDSSARSTLGTKAPTQNSAAPEPLEHVEFTVPIGAAPTSAEPSDGGASDDPSLPITGPGAATMAGTGAALVGLGVFLLLALRRRRARIEIE